jgi:hypothetical protein
MRILPSLLAPAALFATLSGCYRAVEDPIYTPCLIAGSSDWRAFTEADGKDRRLVVTGTVVVPTGGHHVTLERGYVQELEPPHQQVILRSVPPDGPATQALVTHRVSEGFEAVKDLGGVTVRCGDRVLAVIEPVEAR